MRLINLTDFDKTRKSILLLNGGGQIPFSKHNKITRFFSEYDYNIIAVELPGHGKSKFNQIMSQEEFIKHFEYEFPKLIEEKGIITKAMVGFSLGGLFALKAVEKKLIEVDCFIGYGCGFGIGNDERGTFNYYTSQKFFDDMNWDPIMKKNHGEGWLNLLHSMDKLMHVESPIFINPEQLDNETQIILILGENEELFTPQYNQEVANKNTLDKVHIIVIPNTTHFDYTAKSWDGFNTKLKDFFNKCEWFG
ncbi:MAG: hypothetical protein ACW99A_04400 [Candidatus Kariarchaeaceae archaeon]|jgi:pimeloyl-ACP methyl ester carboxylesterase